MRIKIKKSDTFVVFENYTGEIENHPVLTDFPNEYELTLDEPTETSGVFICTYLGDERLASEYYLVRETVGKSLVNDVSNDLLSQYKRGDLTFNQIMDIEESLKEVIYSLRGGQFYTASYKLSIAQGVPEIMKTNLTNTINLLIQTHYV
jgi:hypothetical protein